MSLRGTERESVDADAVSDFDRTHVRAQFTIEPHPDAACSVLATGERGSDVDQDLLCRDGTCDGNCECRSEVSKSTDTESESVYVQSDVNDHCICPVFRSYDCIASIDRIRDASLEVSITAPTRDELERVIDALRKTGATVRLERIACSERGSNAAFDRLGAEPDADHLTEKQREAVVAAVEAGYYESPRKADLGDLAAELGVSRSAVSQRLNAVESKLVTAIVRN